MQLLPQIAFGDDVRLSIQASAGHYCSPRVSGLPINEYDSVEIALIHKGDFVVPSRVGVSGFDDLYHGDDVAGWVPVDRVIALVKALAEVKGIEAPALPALD